MFFTILLLCHKHFRFLIFIPEFHGISCIPSCWTKKGSQTKIKANGMTKCNDLKIWHFVCRIWLKPLDVIIKYINETLIGYGRYGEYNIGVCLARNSRSRRGSLVTLTTESRISNFPPRHVFDVIHERFLEH